MILVGVVAGSGGGITVTTPSAPTSFTATAASSTQINLSWAVPSNNGGAAITSYTLKNGATTIYTGAGTSYSNTGLSPATAYSYTVLATNSAGDGPTASASATTSTSAPAAPTITYAATGSYPIYDAEGYDIVGYGTTYTIYISSNGNGGSAITNTRWEYSNNGTTFYILSYNPGYQVTQINGVSDAGQYHRISYINAVGVGPPSNVVYL